MKVKKTPEQPACSIQVPQERDGNKYAQEIFLLESEALELSAGIINVLFPDLFAKTGGIYGDEWRLNVSSKFWKYYEDLKNG